MSKPVTLGLIVGNRGFFPDHLVQSGRQTMLRVLAEEGLRVVALGEEESKFGSVESLADARKCADLFRRHREEMDGVVVTLPNFGDERAVATALRLADLRVPVLVHAFPDTPGFLTVRDRRDSFCGKMSVCNNLHQYGIPFTLTRRHTVDPDHPSFREDLRAFAGVCRVVRALRGARLGAIGARPAAFNTVRYSEKLLEHTGISVETIDLSEVLGQAERLADEDPAVRDKLQEVYGYTATQGVPPPSLLKMAKLGVVVDRWMRERDLVATAIQCWTALEEYFGVVPCTIMSMMSNNLLPSACETDIPGAVSMYVLQEASGTPSAIVDWNNNYGDDPDKGIVFHCSNLPKHFFQSMKMDYQEIIAGTVGKDRTYGTVVGRVRPGPFTYCRVSTDDLHGRITAYVGEGRFTDDPVSTFGGYGVVHIPRLQELLHHICEHGFEHHVAVNLGEVARVVDEALRTYMGWEVYWHR